MKTPDEFSHKYADQTGAERKKLPTGIPNFDKLTKGGLPEGRATLVTGSSGSSKTVLAIQFLVEGIRQYGQPGVFVTFEETPADLKPDMSGFGWDIAKYEEEGSWAFVDVSPTLDAECAVIGEFDLAALFSRIEGAVKRIGAKRIAIDSIGSIFSQIENPSLVRKELFRLVGALKRLGITAIVTAERINEYGDISRHNVEEFVVDNVIVLRNTLEDEKRRRTIEVLKFRGTSHLKGEYPFTVVSGKGIIVLPLSAIEFEERASSERLTSGNAKLDEMCGGGFFRDSTILVSGATGTGKTLSTMKFLEAGVREGQKCLLFAFEESRNQLIKNASGWGVDLEDLERQGLLRLVCIYPEFTGLEEHLIEIKSFIDEFGPARVGIDSLSALERISTLKSFREFIIYLTALIKNNEITCMFTATTPGLLGGASITESHISTITDTIVLLRYVELLGQMRRGITVLKMRGSMHDKDIRSYSIDETGMRIGPPYRNITGSLSGNFLHISTGEVEKMSDMLREEGATGIGSENDYSRNEKED